jgi:serine/threonine protein kinase
LNYMAPEITSRGYDFKADIFSIGALFYQLCVMKVGDIFIE